jgi:hypothetical protein
MRPRSGPLLRHLEKQQIRQLLRAWPERGRRIITTYLRTAQAGSSSHRREGRYSSSRVFERCLMNSWFMFCRAGKPTTLLGSARYTCWCVLHFLPAGYLSSA